MNKSDVPQAVLDVWNFSSLLIQHTNDLLILNYCEHLEKLDCSNQEEIQAHTHLLMQCLS